jgi:hypothetical protein
VEEEAEADDTGVDEMVPEQEETAGKFKFLSPARTVNSFYFLV